MNHRLYLILLFAVHYVMTAATMIMWTTMATTTTSMLRRNKLAIACSSNGNSRFMCTVPCFSATLSIVFTTTMKSTIAFIDPKRDTRIKWGPYPRIKRERIRAIGTSSSSSSSRLYSCNDSYQEFIKKEEHDKIIVSYFTDIEGDKFYLDRYVHNSKILTWIATTTTKETANEDEPSPPPLYEYPFPYDKRIDFVHSNTMLIFGGDLWDKGKSNEGWSAVCMCVCVCVLHLNFNLADFCGYQNIAHRLFLFFVSRSIFFIFERWI